MTATLEERGSAQASPVLSSQGTPAAIASDMLFMEGLYLDRQEWDAWLALYREDAVFWIPAWTSEHQATRDPDREVSLIYHDNRYGLEERIMRIRSRKSITAMPLPRTIHMVSNVLARLDGAAAIDSTYSWLVHVIDPRTSTHHQHVGRGEMRLVKGLEQEWRIGRKKLYLVNDRIPTTLDFYCV